MIKDIKVNAMTVSSAMVSADGIRVFFSDDSLTVLHFTQ